MSLLDIKNLSVSFGHGAGRSFAAKGVDLSIEKGETVALVGESGSGKSVTALSILQLLSYPNAQNPTGTIRLNGEVIFEGGPELSAPPPAPWRGTKITMVFQEPMTSLNPLHTIEKQIGEVLRLHKHMSREAARARTIELLHLVALPEPEKRLTAYPHELSGGQRQRVMIAMALAGEPELLIADEPTTALDVTIQAQILTLLKELQKKLGMALLLITHDLTLVRSLADRVYVMNKGEIVESGETAQLFAAPKHPYTRLLLGSEPTGHAPAPDPAAPLCLIAEDMRVYFPIKKGLLRRTVGHVRAVDGISFELRRGATIGIVGESGSGKTTLGLALLRLLPAQGRVTFEGKDLTRLTLNEMRPLRRSIQMVFQDPFGSLDPRFTIGDIVAEGLDIHRLAPTRAARTARVAAALEEVGLDPALKDRYPHEFSGGQRQRIAIARAMIMNPEIVVLDEPTSALDLSVQAQIIDLLLRLQKQHGLAYLFISHDLSVVRAMASELIVMKEGRVVEQGPAERLFTAPQAPYTKTLLAAALSKAVA